MTTCSDSTEHFGDLDLDYDDLERFPEKCTTLHGSILSQEEPCSAIPAALQYIDGDIDVSGSLISSLNENIRLVTGYIDISDTPIAALPCTLERVEASLLVSHTGIQSLPKSLVEVNGALVIEGSEIEELSDGLRVNGPIFMDSDNPLKNTLQFLDTYIYIQNVPNLVLQYELLLLETSLKTFPSNVIEINGNFVISNSKVADLSNSLRAVHGLMDVSETILRELPSSLEEVADDLNITETFISFLPESLRQVGSIQTAHHVVASSHLIEENPGLEENEYLIVVDDYSVEVLLEKAGELSDALQVQACILTAIPRMTDEHSQVLADILLQHPNDRRIRKSGEAQLQTFSQQPSSPTR